MARQAVSEKDCMSLKEPQWKAEGVEESWLFVLTMWSISASLRVIIKL